MQFFGRSAADLHRSMTLTTMASPIVLVPGNCYFYCSFYDKALLFPCIQTLQFVSCLEVDDGPLWLFQEPVESFEDKARQPGSDELQQLVFRENQLCEILDVNGLQRVLGEVANFHPISRPLPVASEMRESAALIAEYELSNRIANVLTTQSDSSLHLRIRFTDHGLFVNKKGGIVEAQFYLARLRQPEIESATLSFFTREGIEASTNYLSDDGRTRILAYPLNGDTEHIAELCAQIFVAVLGMRASDELVLSSSN
jgi:hypothetical protein